MSLSVASQTSQSYLLQLMQTRAAASGVSDETARSGSGASSAGQTSAVAVSAGPSRMGAAIAAIMTQMMSSSDPADLPSKARGAAIEPAADHVQTGGASEADSVAASHIEVASVAPTPQRQPNSWASATSADFSSMLGEIMDTTADAPAFGGSTALAHVMDAYATS